MEKKTLDLYSKEKASIYKKSSATEDLMNGIMGDDFKLTPDGVELLGAMDALKENLQQFPTYSDLLQRHSKHFNIKEPSTVC